MKLFIFLIALFIAAAVPVIGWFIFAAVCFWLSTTIGESLFKKEYTYTSLSETRPTITSRDLAYKPMADSIGKLADDLRKVREELEESNRESQKRVEELGLNKKERRPGSMMGSEIMKRVLRPELQILYKHKISEN